MPNFAKGSQFAGTPANTIETFAKRGIQMGFISDIAADSLM
jgi:hypothetical protein